MTVENYYRTSLTLPILVPLIALGIYNLATGSMAVDITAREIDGVNQWGIVGWLGASLIFGGVPYVLTAAYLLWKMRRMDGVAMTRLSWKAPLYMIPIAVVVGPLWMAGGISKVEDIFGLLIVQFFLVPFILIFGYAYVLLVNGMLLLLRSLGWVHEEKRQPL